MSSDEGTPNNPSCETPGPEWKIRPFDIAAIAMAMSVYRREREQGRSAGMGQQTAPKDCIDAAYELLKDAIGRWQTGTNGFYREADCRTLGGW
jgi:hypothetical protein